MDEPIETKEKPRKMKLATVKVIEQRGAAALVEWVEGGAARRVIIPADTVTPEGNVSTETLAAGVPYGVAWETIQIKTPSGKEIADELHKAGIWTKDDLFSNPRIAQACVMNLFGAGLGDLIRLAAEQSQEV